MCSYILLTSKFSKFAVAVVTNSLFPFGSLHLQNQSNLLAHENVFIVFKYIHTSFGLLCGRIPAQRSSSNEEIPQDREKGNSEHFALQSCCKMEQRILIEIDFKAVAILIRYLVPAA